MQDNCMECVAMNNTWLNVLMTALAPAIWGSTYIVTTELLPPDRPFTAALLRAMPAGLLLVLYSRYWPARRDWPRLLVLAALNIGFFQALLFVAAYRLPGGLAAVVGAIQPLLMMGLVWSLDRQRPASAAVVASVVGIAGMAALLLAPGARWDLIGIVAAFVGTACMASGTYLTRRWQLSPPLLAFTGWQLLLGGLLLLPLAYWIAPPYPRSAHSTGWAIPTCPCSARCWRMACGFAALPAWHRWRCRRWAYSAPWWRCCWVGCYSISA
jgi:probable blue pigment (indigoidine) exporter